MKTPMKKIACILLVAGTLIFQGCDNFLDVKPKMITIPSVFQDYQKLMSNITLVRVATNYPIFLTDDVLLLDQVNGKDASALSFATHSEVDRNIYTFKAGQVYTDGESDQLWNSLYGQIYTYNTVINDIMSVADASQSEKLRLRSEALFARAFQYFILVNAYGRHYDKGTAATDYGVPIILQADITLKFNRNTVAEVYQLIENDLKEAAPNLRDKAPFTTYPSKSTINSFYARLYLYMGRYEEALVAAKAALAVKNDLYDFKPYVVSTKPMTWGRIQLPNNGAAFLYNNDNPECLYLRNQAMQVSNTSCVSQDLRDVFKRDLPVGATDMRRALFYADDQVSYGGSPTIFPGETTFGAWIEHNIGFTTSENMLIAAECEARIGSKDLAMQHINKLRDARVKNNVALSAVSNDDALVKVLDERRREFAFVGFHRLFDLKRLNKEDKFKKTVVHTVEGQPFSLEPNDNKYILPVSTQVMDFNPSMPQYQR